MSRGGALIYRAVPCSASARAGGVARADGPTQRRDRPEGAVAGHDKCYVNTSVCCESPVDSSCVPHRLSLACCPLLLWQQITMSRTSAPQPYLHNILPPQHRICPTPPPHSTALQTCEASFLPKCIVAAREGKFHLECNQIRERRRTHPSHPLSSHSSNTRTRAL